MFIALLAFVLLPSQIDEVIEKVLVRFQTKVSH